MVVVAFDQFDFRVGGRGRREQPTVLDGDDVVGAGVHQHDAHAFGQTRASGLYCSAAGASSRVGPRHSLRSSSATATAPPNDEPISTSGWKRAKVPA